MVSLSAIEEILEKLYAGSVLGVVALEDDKKGEQLALVINNESASIADIQQHFKAKGLSPLWVPKNVFYLKNPPLLASGKFDYQEAKKILKNQSL